MVYWFGAGASAQALPVVGELPDALRDQVHRIRRLLKHPEEIGEELALYERELHNLADLAVVYGTLDTYARALYLGGDPQNELAALKLNLSMFFILEPFLAKAKPMTAQRRGMYTRQYRVDPRYMSWLALLLGDGLKLNPRVKVISWNYDFQVEFALAQYCQAGALDQAHGRYRIHPTPDTTRIDTDNFFLTHLNGIAGQELRSDGVQPWYRMHVGFYPDALRGVFRRYGEKGERGVKTRHAFTERLTFAWENKPVAVEALSMAERALRDADVLVVVGYSFPAFNRLVDTRLMRAFDQGGNRKRLVLQNPRINRADLLNLFDVDTDRVTVVTDASTDQFHLPNELFAT